MLNLRGRTNSEVSRRWLSITHADVMLSCADWRGQVVQRKQQGLSSSIAGRCAGSCARCSTGLARQRAVECTHGRGTAPCCPDIGWCAAGYRQRGSSRRVHDHGIAGPPRFEATLLIGFEATLIRFEATLVFFSETTFLRTAARTRWGLQSMLYSVRSYCTGYSK